MSDDYSDVDIALLVDGKQFDQFPFYLERCLENVSAKIILCWPEGFNSGAIINNGYLLLSGSNIFQYALSISLYVFLSNFPSCT